MESTSEIKNNEQSTAIKTGDHHDPNVNNQQKKPSKSELLASAKVVADAARHRGENKVDKAEVAGAAANLLQAASEYGKLEDKSLGKYMEKAENHLRKYNTSHSSTNTGHSNNTTGTTHSSNNHPGKGHGHSSSVNSGGDHQGEKGKYDDYIKLAEGLAEGILKKNSGGGGGSGSHASDTSNANTHSGTGGEHGGHSGSGNGYGQYVKMAGDFLKKH